MGLLDRDLRFTLFEGDAFAPYWEPDEIVGKLLSEMIPPERYAEVLPHIEAALAGEHRHARVARCALRSHLPRRPPPLPRARRAPSRT